ncbi:MAG TPA: hypothetical protein VL974_17155 [Magnetospirillum sp.]|jgi:hypothetical protein|nr:hypothetical protein [Magnetospirillum sp.]
MDETKLTADLPNMRMEIVHRAAPDGNGEMITLNLHATPDFRAALPLMAEAMQHLPLMGGAMPFPSPLALWTQAAQAMMAPWLALARANPFLALPLDEKLVSSKK